MTPQSVLLLALQVASVAAVPFSGMVLEREDQTLDSYDYVVIGGGTAGLTVANRLSESPDITVLVLEAGGFDQRDCAALLPRCLGDTMRSSYDWNITTVPQTSLLGPNNTRQNLPLGRAFGGSSLLNGMMFDRASPSDIDAWGELGNPSWSWNTLLPYYKKSEAFTPPTKQQQEELGITWDPEVHGSEGYVQSGYPSYIFPQDKNFQEGMKELGVSHSKDQAGSAIGSFWSPNSIDPKNMTRSYARSAYYGKFTGRKNLHVLINRHVTNLGVEKATEQNKKATVTGVNYVLDGAQETVYTAKATREYILAAGTVHDPQILQLSGIGPKALLEKHSIPVAVNLPGVGNNLQDHPVSTLSLHLEKAVHSIMELGTNATYDAESKAQYYANRTGPWTAGGPNSVAFLPLSIYSNETASLLSSYTAQNATSYLREGIDATLVAGWKKARSVLTKRLATEHMAAMEFIWLSGANRRYEMPFSISIQHPLSRGYVEINSSSPFVPPVVDLRTASNPIDVSLFVPAFRYARRLIATSAIAGDLGGVELTPGDSVDENDSAAVEKWLRQTLSTMFHPSGTSAMIPRAWGGVVDEQLRVHGVKDLRVVDASIFPAIPGTHLQATVYAVAEKASDIIKKAQK